jgi:hypothetical protein
MAVIHEALISSIMLVWIMSLVHHLECPWHVLRLDEQRSVAMQQQGAHDET